MIYLCDCDEWCAHSLCVEKSLLSVMMGSRVLLLHAQCEFVYYTSLWLIISLVFLLYFYFFLEENGCEASVVCMCVQGCGSNGKKRRM